MTPIESPAEQSGPEPEPGTHTRGRERPRLASADLARIAVMAAVIAALGLPGQLPVAGLPVPITLQTLGVMLAGALLGARRGALAVATMLLLVAAGLPLLAGGRGGLGVFAAASAGFLIGWVPGAWLVGALVERRPQRLVQGWLLMACLAGGVGVVYLLGVPVMAWRGGLELDDAVRTALVTFLPGDAAKAVVAAVLSAGVLRGWPEAAPRARRTQAEPVAVSSGGGPGVGGAPSAPDQA